MWGGDGKGKKREEEEGEEGEGYVVFTIPNNLNFPTTILMPLHFFFFVEL